MPRRTLDIVNRLGLHARAAAQFVKVAGAYGARVSVEKDGQSADGKSIMAVMMLAASKGSTLHLHTEGEQEHEALAALVALIDDYFEEGE